jgi:zinc transporter ZupT
VTESPSVGVRQRFPFQTILLILLPIVLLGAVIAVFLAQGGMGLQSAAPVEALTIERYVLHRGQITLFLRNSGAEPVTISQVIINDAVWPFTILPATEIPRLGRAAITLDYPWSHAEAYAIRLFTSNAIPFELQIPVAFETPRPAASTFWSFALIGIYVGVIPVFLGILWFPALRRLGRRWMTFLMAITAGLLIFLGFDTITEAFDQAAEVPGPFQGTGLIAIGAVATFLLLDAISRGQASVKATEADRRAAVALMIAAGIGFHNLGEGLAIGAAYSVGEIAFGTFLVVGFIIQNITEGLGIIAPVLRDRPQIGRLALLGLIGGAPAILGAWIGGFSPSPALAVLFLGIGTGAIFEVVYEIAKLIQKDTVKEGMPILIFAGTLTGMLILWVTGLWIK